MPLASVELATSAVLGYTPKHHRIVRWCLNVFDAILKQINAKKRRERHQHYLSKRKHKIVNGFNGQTFKWCDRVWVGIFFATKVTFLYDSAPKLHWMVYLCLDVFGTVQNIPVHTCNYPWANVVTKNAQKKQRICSRWRPRCLQQTHLEDAKNREQSLDWPWGVPLPFSVIRRFCYEPKEPVR